MTLVRPLPPLSTTADPVAPEDRFRPDVQGLRALAVGLVVGFHLWPNRLSGGFVGVDVFFVISGYLITAHLFREARNTGRIQLGQFWARRIRRLLPASFLVLLVSLGLVVLFLPITLWSDSARQVAASALYVQNWALLRDSVSYMAQGSTPTLVEHYWSLSVEEQFYLLWPLLMAGAVVAGRTYRRSPLQSERRINGSILAIGVVMVASLTYSVTATAADQAAAYFATPTRVWEFAAGGLLALTAARIRRPSAAVLAGWAGLAAIVVSALALDSASPFPGWIALFPVLGTVLVIAAAETRARWSVGRVLELRPATFVGDISYSVYLWHWPLIVVVPFITDVPLRFGDKVGILITTFLLSWATKIFVEDRLRSSPFLGSASWRSVAFAAAGMALIVGLALVVDDEVEKAAAASRASASHALDGGTSGCTGPAALTAANDCRSPGGAGKFIPSPAAVQQDKKRDTYGWCRTALNSADLRDCALGTTDDPEQTIAVIGDSHATMWLAAFDELGHERGWAIRAYTKSSCPFSAATRTIVAETNSAEAGLCRAWTDAALDALVADESVKTVIATGFGSVYGWKAPDGSSMGDPRTDGFLRVWQRLQQAGKQVVVLRDVPRTTGEDPPTCLAAHRRSRDVCANPRDRALQPDAWVDAARKTGIEVLDLTDQFCDDELCYAAVGNVIVYVDSSHLSQTYARALAPYLGRTVDQLSGF